VGASFFRPINLKSDHTGTANLTIIKKLSNAFGRLIRNPNFLMYSTSIALTISGKFMVNPFVKLYAVKNVGLEKYQPAMRRDQNKSIFNSGTHTAHLNEQRPFFLFFLDDNARNM
jgi:hypothetical protein